MPAIEGSMQVQHWMPLILDYVKTLYGQPNATVCALAAMAGLEIAAAKAQQPLPEDLLKEASKWISSEEMRSLQQSDLHRQMVMVTSNLIDLAGPAVASVAEQLFHCLMHLQGQHGLDAYTREQIDEVCTGSQSREGQFVLDADIKKCFDRINQAA
jgi:hypothetical protein